MPRLMFITPQAGSGAPGGRALLSRVHRNCLASLYGDRFLPVELDTGPPATLSGRANRLLGYIDGVTPAVTRSLIARIVDEDVSHVYLDGSNLGRLARALRKELPHVQVLSFCHNVEGRFFLGALRETKSLHALGVLCANYLAERMAVRHSHRVIALSQRDSRGLNRLYGRAATDILPMAMEDRFQGAEALASAGPASNYALFVGGAFYANEAGIRWFVQNVVPRIDLKVCVVGRGMEQLKAELERPGKVEIVGGVDSLQDWYLGAKVAIAPIFDGSGMKTKVAEALMFGKKIIGTSEAFSGYEQHSAKAGWTCDTPEQFVAAIEGLRAQRETIERFDPGLRRLYETEYSAGAARARLSAILASCGLEPRAG